MLHTQKPDIFTPKFEVVSCFLEHEGKILLLLRQDHKSEPNTYGVPAGKVSEGELHHDAIVREIFEETGLQVSDLSYIQEVYVKYPSYDFIYHIYHKKLEAEPEITINLEEHKHHIWRTPEEALTEALIQDEDACIKIVYKI